MRLPELHSLKLEIGIVPSSDEVSHFPSQEGKWQDLSSQKL